MNVSISEIIVILLIALLVIKPDQLPEVAYSLGRMIQSFRALLGKTKKEINNLVESVNPSGEQNRES